MENHTMQPGNCFFLKNQLSCKKSKRKMREGMKQGHYEEKTCATQKEKWLWLLLLIPLILGIGAYGFLQAGKPKAETPNGVSADQFGGGEKDPDSIAIPGYEGIDLKADTRQQTVGLPNPSQNTCYFQITLSLEDGTVLWQSQLVEPGEVSEPMKLNEALPAGTYPNAVLHFSCYTMDGSMTPLNSAETGLTLWVR